MSLMALFSDPFANTRSRQAMVGIAAVLQTMSTPGYRVQPSITTSSKSTFGNGPKKSMQTVSQACCGISTFSRGAGYLVVRRIDRQGMSEHNLQQVSLFVETILSHESVSLSSQGPGGLRGLDRLLFV